jgi:glutaredoxin 3
MPDVVAYTSQYCPYCARAKRLLRAKNVAFTEIDVDEDPAERMEMTKLAEGRYTVPQIFIDGRPVGGSDELAALDRCGKLDELLGL